LSGIAINNKRRDSTALQRQQALRAFANRSRDQFTQYSRVRGRSACQSVSRDPQATCARHDLMRASVVPDRHPGTVDQYDAEGEVIERAGDDVGLKLGRVQAYLQAQSAVEVGSDQPKIFSLERAPVFPQCRDQSSAHGFPRRRRGLHAPEGLQIAAGHPQPDRLARGDVFLRRERADEYDLEKTDDQLSVFLRILIELPQIGAGEGHGAMTAGVEGGLAEHQIPRTSGRI
jgi:hypothetical protein